MEINETSNRIHPLMAGAAASVMLVSLIGVAAITGVLPNSHGTSAPMAASNSAPTALAVASNVPATDETPYPSAAPAPALAAPVVHHKHVAKHAATDYSQAAPSTQYAQTSDAGRTYQQPNQQPAQQPIQQPVQQPAAQTNYLGIGAGALIGGLLGNHVGGGNGRALATVAGAVGGGLLGNEVEKRSR